MGPSLGVFQGGAPHHRSSNSPIFADSDPNCKLWAEDDARKAFWQWAKTLHRIRGTYLENEDRFFSPKDGLGSSIYFNRQSRRKIIQCGFWCLCANDEATTVSRLPTTSSDTDISGSAGDSAENTKMLALSDRGAKQASRNRLRDTRSTSSGSDRKDPPEPPGPDPLLSNKSSWKHNLFTHFLRYSNCDMCERAACRRNSQSHILRATKFADNITADLNEDGKSRNNQRYATVVQDLATQWIQSFPYKTKTSQETIESKGDIH